MSLTDLTPSSVNTNVSISDKNEIEEYQYGLPVTDFPAEESVETNYSYLSPIIKTSRTRTADSFKVYNFSPTKEDVKQIWRGVVTGIEDNEFIARLEDDTNPNSPDQEVWIPLAEIEARDLKLLELGAMFFWHIGYRYGPKYPQERFSKIKFRRLPQWQGNEIESAKLKAQEYKDFFLTDSANTTGE